MSDFDKEAERERLREKYEREQEKRQSTERMSELLLKGATMTNAHCEQCGDPIFRYDGQEFCPTCQQVVADDGADADATDADDADAISDADDESGADGERDVEGKTRTLDDEIAASADAPRDGRDADATAGTAEAGDETAGRAPGDIEIKQPTGPRAGQPTDANGAERRDDAAADRQTTPEQTSTQRNARDDSVSQQPGERRQSGAPRSVPSVQPASQAGEDDALVAARASLTRTLLKQSRAAERADDPGQARDHLAAAREAAEALSALSSY